MKAQQLLSLMACVMLLPACGPKNFLNENDTLRRRVMELEGRVQELETRAVGAEKQLEIQKQGPDASRAGLPEGLHAPVVTRIAIAGASRGVDENKDGRDEAVRLYLQTFDKQDRFLPTVAEVKVTLSTAKAGQQAVTIAAASFSAVEFDQAYRSGIGGTHYTLRVPLDQPLPEGVQDLTASVELKDLLTGATFEAGKRVNVSNVQ